MINSTVVDSGALTMALNVLRRAGKIAAADALEATAIRLDGSQRVTPKVPTFEMCNAFRYTLGDEKLTNYSIALGYDSMLAVAPPASPSPHPQ